MRVEREKSSFHRLSIINSQLSTPTTLGVVNYGSGNLRSVCKALDAVGAHTRLIDAPDQLAEIDAVVVPGVGAFGDCARNLRATGLWEPLREWIAADRPYLGICLGYQLLFEGSEETPGVPGLGVLPGFVRRFPDGPLKVPHMGWNRVTTARASPLTDSLPEEPRFYFVHSFYARCRDPQDVLLTTSYGETFHSGIQRGNVYGVQFHPEKSHMFGMALLRSFATRVN